MYLSIVKNKNGSAKDLTHDLSLITKWVFKKMLFNPDPTKSALEVIYSAYPNIFLIIYQSKKFHTKNILEHILKNIPWNIYLRIV